MTRALAATVLLTLLLSTLGLVLTTTSRWESLIAVALATLGVVITVSDASKSAARNAGNP